MENRKRSFTVYNQSEAGRAARKRYRQSAKGKAANGRFHHSPKGLRIRQNARLKRRLGITIDDKERMYQEQKGLCAMCHKPLPTCISHCDTDHEPGTKRIRGLLHEHCNLLVGTVEKESELLELAKTYLREAEWLKEEATE
jgi:hypothetical protein